MLLKGPKLTPSQWKYLATGASNVSLAIIIFSLAAIFVPETVNLTGEFSQAKAVFYLICGFLLFGVGVIISKNVKEK